MNTKASLSDWDPLFWPLFIGGFASPFAGKVFEQWLSPAVAGGVGMVAAWTLVGIAVSFKPPVPNWSLPKWIVCAGVGAALGGGVAFLLDK